MDTENGMIETEDARLILRNQLVIMEALAVVAGDRPELRRQVQEIKTRISSWSEQLLGEEGDRPPRPDPSEPFRKG